MASTTIHCVIIRIIEMLGYVALYLLRTLLSFQDALATPGCVDTDTRLMAIVQLTLAIYGYLTKEDIMTATSGCCLKYCSF